MRIECPFCGSRNHDEFIYGGDATRQHPNINSENMGEWYDYIFKRNNPRGPHDELWYHHYGCRQWLIVRRDTTSHEIINVKPAKPAESAESAESAKHAESAKKDTVKSEIKKNKEAHNEK